MKGTNSGPNRKVRSNSKRKVVLVDSVGKMSHKKVFVRWDTFEKTVWSDYYEELGRPREEWVVEGVYGSKVAIVRGKEVINIKFKVLNNFSFSADKEWIEKHGNSTSCGEYGIIAEGDLVPKGRLATKINFYQFPSPKETANTEGIIKDLEIQRKQDNTQDSGVGTWNVNGHAEDGIILADALCRAAGLDIFILTDTRHCRSSQNFLADRWCRGRPGGKAFFSKSSNKVGGVIILVGSKLGPFTEGTYDDASGLGVYYEVKMKIENRTIRVGGIYWPFKARKIEQGQLGLDMRLSKWLQQNRSGIATEDYVREVVRARVNKSHQQVILAGDFNTTMGDSRYHFLEELGLKNPHVQENIKTKASGRQIDHVFSSLEATRFGYSDDGNFSISDHFPLWAFHKLVEGVEYRPSQRICRSSRKLDNTEVAAKIRERIHQRQSACGSAEELNNLIVEECSQESKSFMFNYWSPEYSRDLIVHTTLARIVARPRRGKLLWLKGRARIAKIGKDSEELWTSSMLYGDWQQTVVNRRELLQRAKAELHHRRKVDKYARFKDAIARREKPEHLFKEIGLKKHRFDLTSVITEEGLLSDPIEIHQALIKEFQSMFKKTKVFPKGDPLQMVGTIEGCCQFFGVEAEDGEILWAALNSTKDTRQKIQQELDFLQKGPTLTMFMEELKMSSKKSAGGPSGLTYEMLQVQSSSTLEMLFNLLQADWIENGSLTQHWLKKKLMCLVPKKSDLNELSNIRPVVLCEVLRKVWLGAIVREFRSTWERHNILQANQFGFRTRRSCADCLLQMTNLFELGIPIFFSSWDLRNAFPSVAREIIVLGLQRLGVPLELARGLSRVDENDLVIPLSPSGECSGFSTERGIGQGDKGSPTIWTAVMDIILTVAAMQRSELFFVGLQGRVYEARDMAYADDLITATGSHEKLQIKANLISMVTRALGMEIAVSKLRTGVMGGTTNSQLSVEGTDGMTNICYMKETEMFKYLGVTFNSRGSLLRVEHVTQKIIHHIEQKLASHQSYSMFVAGALIPKVAYSCTFSMSNLEEHRKLDRSITQFYKRRLKLAKSFPTALLYAAEESGGLGLKRLSTEIQKAKWRTLHRGLSGSPNTRAAVEGLIWRHASHRGDCYVVDHKSGWIGSLAESLEELGSFLRIGARFSRDFFPLTVREDQVSWVVMGGDESKAACFEFRAAYIPRWPRRSNSAREHTVGGGFVWKKWQDLDLDPLQPVTRTVEFTLSDMLCTDGSWTSETEAGAAIVSVGRTVDKIRLRGYPEAPDRAFAQEALAIAVGIGMYKIAGKSGTVFTDCQSAIRVLQGSRERRYSTSHLLLRAARSVKQVTVKWVKAHKAQLSSQEEVGNAIADRVADGRSAARDGSPEMLLCLDALERVYLADGHVPNWYHNRVYDRHVGKKYYLDRRERVEHRPNPAMEEVVAVLKTGRTLGQKAALLRLVLGKFEDDRQAWEGTREKCCCGCRNILEDWIFKCEREGVKSLREDYFATVIEFGRRHRRDVTLDQNMIRGALGSLTQAWPRDLAHDFRSMITKLALEFRRKVRSLTEKAVETEGVQRRGAMSTSQSLLSEFFQVDGRSSVESRRAHFARSTRGKGQGHLRVWTSALA